MLHYKNLLSIFWKYAKEKKINILIFYTLFLFANISVMMKPLIIGDFINNIQHDPSNIVNHIYWLIIFYTCSVVVFWSFFAPARIIEKKLSILVYKNFLNHIYKRILSFNTHWHENNNSGNITDRIKTSSSALLDFSHKQFLFFLIFSRIVVSILIIGYSSLITSFFIIIYVVSIMYFSIYLDKKINKHSVEKNSLEHNIFSSLQENISNIITSISIKLEKHSIPKINNAIKKIFKPFFKESYLTESKWMIITTLLSFLECITIFLYIIYQPTLSIGSIVAIYNYLIIINDMLQLFMFNYAELVRDHAAVQSCDKILEYSEFKKSYAIENTSVKNWNNIQISDICYSINGNKILNNMDIEINQNQTIALVGKSGSGKTTLMKIMSGIYESQQEANLLIDGTKYNMDEVKNSSILIPQEQEIFSDSLMYNLTLGYHHEDQVIEDIKDVTHVKEILTNINKENSYILKEKGRNLSGGQKQRICLARGLLAAYNYPIILMDEPTSSLDQKTEASIYKNIFSFYKGKTIISSIHKLHLLNLFDYIYIVDNGEIVNKGTYPEIIKYLNDISAKDDLDL